MISAPIPADEAERLSELRRMDLLDTLPEEVFDRIVRLAQLLTDQPIAVFSLVDEGRQWFKALVGMETRQTSRDIAFCAHTIRGDGMTVIDTHADPRFFDNPLVTSAPCIRSYFGRTVRGPSGRALGTLCVFGPEPKIPTDEQLKALADLAFLTQELVRYRVAAARP